MKVHRLVQWALFSFFVISSVFYVLMLGGEANRFITNALFLVPPFLAVALGLGAMQVYGWRNAHGLSLGLLSLGFGSWFVGEVIWFVLRIIMNIDPYPSVADIFYLLGYPLLFIGLLLELKEQRLEIRDIDPFTRTLVVFFLFVLYAFVLYFQLFLAYDPSASLIENFTAISYGLGDFVLIIPAVLVLKTTLDFQKGRLYTPWLAVFTGLFLTLIADLLYSIYTEQYSATLFPYNLIDLFWIGGYLALAYGFFGIRSVIESAHKRLEKK